MDWLSNSIEVRTGIRRPVRCPRVTLLEEHSPSEDEVPGQGDDLFSIAVECDEVVGAGQDDQ